ncbi:hypothetical protein BDN71DRAFT_1404501, partial [Pleurotus eryngii]
PIARDSPSNDNWTPFIDRQQFTIADLLFRKVEMSASNLDELFMILSHPGNMAEQDLSDNDDTEPPTVRRSPFKDHDDMYSAIDSSLLGDAPWHCYQIDSDDLDDPCQWKQKTYNVWYRDPDVVLQNMLDNLCGNTNNPDFNGEFDYSPYIEVDEQELGQRRWGDVMSANFAWCHSTAIYEEHNQQNSGAMYCPIILGSDKTTVSVATGHVEYHPLYISIGNILGSTRRAHRQGVIPIAFLAIPKGMDL